MRRLLLLTTGLLTLALAVPSLAGAHGRHGHHGKHHKKAHRADLGGRAAGTIASFDGTTLTITLANGSTVSGAVTEDTDIHVIEVTPAPAATARSSHWDGDDRGWDDDDWWRGHRRCGSDDGDASDLVPGATVWKASLEIDEDGAEFEKVKLLVPEQSDS